jgi:cytoplasmic polyadenylation element-binding protein
MPQIINGTQDRVTQVAQTVRNLAKKVEASYTWSGQLPRRMRTKNPIYSCKVFLGGIPYDLTDSDLHCTFAQFGHIQIQWPGKDIKSAIDGAAANKAGYVYIIFEFITNKNLIDYRYQT